MYSSGMDGVLTTDNTGFSAAKLVGAPDQQSCAEDVTLSSMIYFELPTIRKEQHKYE